MYNLLEVLVKLRDDLKLWVTNNLQALKNEIDLKSEFSGSYEDLSDKPDINNMIETAIDPLEGAIETLQEQDTTLQNNINVHIENDDIHVTLNDKNNWNNKSDFSGNYSDLIDAPDIADDGSGELKFVDEAGNIILQIDNEGLHTTNIEAIENINAVNADIDNINANTIVLNGENIVNTMESKVNTKFSELVDSAPTTLDTLNKLATALGNDPNFATTVVTQLGLKANKTELPTKVSDLVNDEGYLTEIPSEYATESEVNTIVGDALAPFNIDLASVKANITKNTNDISNIKNTKVDAVTEEELVALMDSIFISTAAE